MMVTVTAPVSGEDGLLTRSSLIRTILVVEPGPEKNESFAQLLPSKPHQYVKLVGSTAAALDFVKHIKPDLFLVKHHPPDIDALTLYDLLHETRGLASIPAIIVGVPLPQPALAVIKTQHLVVLSTAIGLEELIHDMIRRSGCDA
jgi:CheY-like chemotaxis protein